MAYKPIVWTIKELSDMIKDGIKNNFDAFILITGATGTGKSSLAIKLLNKYPDFKLKDKLVYRRDKLIHLVKDYKKSYAFADELISMGSKRKWYNIEQNELIEVLTTCRSNFNILIACIPIFFSADKELLKLVSLHLQVVERGLVIIHMPIRNRIFSDDIWDVSINQKQENFWSKMRRKNPNYKPKYWKYTTFAGFLHFNKLTDKQETEYEALKKQGRNEISSKGDDDKKEGFYDKVLKMLRERKLDEQGLLQLCLFEGKKLSSVKVSLNRMLKDEGNEKTLKDLLKNTNNNKHNTNYLYNNTIKGLSSLEPPTNQSR
jgi:hypothetical protein